MRVSSVLLLCAAAQSGIAIASTTPSLNPPASLLPSSVDKRNLLCAIDNAILKLYTSSYSSSALAFCSSLIHVPVITSTTSTFTPTSTFYTTTTPPPTTVVAPASTPTSTVTVTSTPDPVTLVYSTTTPVVTATVTTTPTITNTVTSTPSTTVFKCTANTLKKRTVTSKSTSTTLKTTASNNFKNAIATVASAILSQGCSCISSRIVKSTTNVVATAPAKTTTLTVAGSQVSKTVTPTALATTVTTTITLVPVTTSAVATGLPSTTTITVTTDAVTSVTTSSAPVATISKGSYEPFYLQASGTGDTTIDNRYAQMVPFNGASGVYVLHFGAITDAQLFTLDCTTGFLQASSGLYSGTHPDPSIINTFVFVNDDAAQTYSVTKNVCSINDDLSLTCLGGAGYNHFGYESSLYSQYGVFLISPGDVGPLTLSTVFPA